MRALVKDIVGHPEHRDEIVAFVKSNGGMEYASGRLDFYVQEAVDALSVLPKSYVRYCPLSEFVLCLCLALICA